jgi:hypothetical protein
MAVLPTGIGPVTGGYQIERSLRFNSADSAYLNRTLTTPTNNKIWTWNAWVKRSTLGTAQTLFSAQVDVNNWGIVTILSGDTLSFQQADAGSVDSTVTTTQVFRDVSAWYCLTVVFDSTQATSSNRLKMYLNGVQITAFSTATYLSQNTASRINTAISHQLSRYITATNYLNGYMTEINFVDGQALTPSDFGETDSNTGVWKPKAYTGTYGTNGFYLKFADNSNTTAATLGKDSSGNGNNWTPNNFSVTAGAGNDSLVDSPTNYGADTGVGGTVRGNYATLNPLHYNSLGTDLRNGNLDGYGITSATSPFYRNYPSTIAVSSGKWFCELTIGYIANGFNLGIASAFGTNGLPTTYYSYNFWDQVYIVSGSSSAYGAKASNGDVIGMAVDLDNGTITWYRNGSSQGQKTGIAAGTYFLYTNMGFDSTAQNGSMNFGQRAFAYTAPSGFKALCTQNLPTPTIGATSTTQANDYFNPILWTGDGTNPRSFTGVGFQPDLVWIKSRSNAYGHRLADAVRGVGKELFSNATDAEVTNNNNGSVQAFNSDGFTLSGSTSTSDVNGSGLTFVAWNWNAGGSNATNTAGTITSTVRANTTSGFSIVTYTGTGSNATVGHGLGVAPSMIIVKNRGAVTDWLIYHTSLGATKSIAFDTAAAITSSTRWNDTAPSSTLITLGTSSGVNGSTNTYVAYAFAPVAGYSAFGSYTGNGSTDGPFVYTGFRPRFVIVKRTSGIEKWYMMDTARDIDNPIDITQLVANASDAEATFTAFDFTSNGFKNRTSNVMSNGSGDTYIYMAFAEAPFKYSLAR